MAPDGSQQGLSTGHADPPLGQGGGVEGGVPLEDPPTPSTLTRLHLRPPGRRQVLRLDRPVRRYSRTDALDIVGPVPLGTLVWTDNPGDKHGGLLWPPDGGRPAAALLAV